MPGSVYDPNLDKDKEDEFSPQISSGGTIVGGQQPQESQSQEKGSGRFQNLQGYLEANKGSGFGEKFAGQLDTDINSANPVIEQSGNEFSNRVNQKATRLDSQSRDQMFNNLYNNPEAIANNAQEMEKFQKLRDAKYEGPNALADQQDLYQQAYGAKEKAKSTANAAQNEGGRFALLNNYFGRPGYSQGEKNLDQLLVTQNDAAKSSIQKSREGAAQAQANFQAQSEKAATLAAGARGETDAARKTTREMLGIDESGKYLPFGEQGSTIDPGAAEGMDSLKRNTGGGAVQKYYNQFEQNAKALNEAKNSKFNDLMSALGNRTLNQEELNAIGLNANQSIYNLDPTKYASKAQDLNRSTATEAGQRAKLAALEKLAGQNPSLLDYNAEDLSKQNPYSYNKDALLRDADVAKAAARDAAMGFKIPDFAFEDDYYQGRRNPYGGTIESIMASNDSDESKLQQIQGMLASEYGPKSGMTLENALAAQKSQNRTNIGDKKINALNQLVDLMNRKHGVYNTLGGGMNYADRPEMLIPYNEPATNPNLGQTVVVTEPTNTAVSGSVPLQLSDPYSTGGNLNWGTTISKRRR